MSRVELEGSLDSQSRDTGNHVNGITHGSDTAGEPVGGQFVPGPLGFGEPLQIWSRRLVWSGWQEACDAQF